MKLVAKVRHVTGSTTHHVATGHGGSSQLAAADTVEISGIEGGFLLVRYRAGAFVGDTWHATVEEAQRQATFEFAISPAEWRKDPP